MTRARLTLLLLLSPLAVPVSAQGIDKEDPCYKTLTSQPLWGGTMSKWPKDGETLGSMLPKIPAVWSSRTALNQYIGTLTGVLDRFPNVAMALDDLNGYFNQGWDQGSMLRVNDCLPWLEVLLSRLEDRLRELGGTSGTIGAARPGPKDLRFEQMRKQLHELALVLDRMKRPAAPGRRP